MSEPLIRVGGLRKTFTMGRVQIHALDGVDLEIAPNTFSVIMGPSGSGKSTLLYLVGGLDRPTGGRLEVDGAALETMDENQLAEYRRRKVGFIFQSFNLVSSMTALDNVVFPMRFARIPLGQRRLRGQELLQRVGLSDRVHHRPTELSGGQQQRVAIARALVNQPSLILADEPTGALDTQTSEDIMRLLSELNAQGMTIVMVTHEADIAMWARRRIVFRDGRVVEDRLQPPRIAAAAQPA
jgi:putative ABC transport system ATP-binding protein